MPIVRSLSRRAYLQLRALESNMRELATHRNRAFRLLRASRGALTDGARREFWLEFAWLDQEYRAAVHKLARFCVEHAGVAHHDTAIGERTRT